MQARGAVDWLVWNESVSARETNSFHTAPLRMLPLILAHWLMQRTVPARVKTSTHRRHYARHKKAAAKVGIRMASGRGPRVCGNSGDVVCYAVSLIHMVYSLRMGRLCFT